jgi:hypothetical protein
MAWNVVIAGGGFAGASAARELERLLPKQSARLILVNDVNFMLYTPLLPEAAAGTLEPRHVVTPLRDILHRTNLRLGAIAGHDPEASTVELHTHDGQVEQIRYDQFVVAVGSVSRSLPIPGLDKHAIGFKSLADAIWLRNHVIETLEEANVTEDPERREKLLTYVFVGGGYAGLEALAELQDFAADAIESYPRARLHGMRWVLVEASDRVLPEIDAELADYALRELRGRGIDVRLGTTLEEVSAGPPASHRIPACASSRCRLTSAAACRSTSTCGSGGSIRSGRSATAPLHPIHAVASVRRPRSTPSAKGRSRPATSPPSWVSAAPARSPTRATRPSSTSAATRRWARSAAVPSAASPPGGWPGPTT